MKEAEIGTQKRSAKMSNDIGCKIATCAQTMFGWQLLSHVSDLPDKDQEAIILWLISDEYYVLLKLIDDFNYNNLGQLKENCADRLSKQTSDVLDKLSTVVDLYDVVI